MKTYKNLYPQIYAFENLYWAYRAARRAKRDQETVASFEFDLEFNLLALSEDLRNKKYQPGPYHNFYIYEPKQRLVSAAPFRDRVVHHALCQITEPIWEARFFYHSYACRVKKGTHLALNQCQAWSQKYRYAFHGDIVKYFASIDLQILRHFLSKRITDVDTLWLIDQLLNSGADIQHPDCPVAYFLGDDLFVALRPRSLPIGNLTSQFWANVYLHELDMLVKQELHCPAYLRYMDDFILFCDDKHQLNAWKEAVRDYLGDKLRLVLHPKKSVTFPVNAGIDFCGFRIYPTHRRLRRSSVRRFIKRFRKQRKAYVRGEMTLDQINTSVQCWIAHARHGDTWKLRRRLFADYPFPVPQ